jgi:hypothetical protein
MTKKNRQDWQWWEMENCPDQVEAKVEKTDTKLEHLGTEKRIYVESANSFATSVQGLRSLIINRQNRFFS